MLIGGFMIEEKYFLWAALITGPIALLYFSLAVYAYFKENRIKKMEYKVRGRESFFNASRGPSPLP